MRILAICLFLNAAILTAQDNLSRRFSPYLSIGGSWMRSDIVSRPGWNIETGGNFRLNKRFFAGFGLTSGTTIGQSDFYVQNLKPGIIIFDAGDIYLNDGEVTKSDLKLRTTFNQIQFHFGLVIQPKSIFRENVDLSISGGIALNNISSKLNYTDRRDSINQLWFAVPNPGYNSRVTETLQGGFITVPVDFALNYHYRPTQTWFIQSKIIMGRLGSADVVDEMWPGSTTPKHFFYNVNVGVRFHLLK